MLRFVKRVSKKAGLAPGTLVHVGEKKTEKIRIRVIDYDSATIEEKELATIEECFPYKGKESIIWINLDGLHEVDIIEKIGQTFGLHPLVLEDIVHTDQRPKMDDYDDYFFIVTRMLSYDDATKQITAEQFSLILGMNIIISFQERLGDVFSSVRERLRKGKGRIRSSGSDYLAYALMDAIVDNYFFVLEKIGTEVEDLEEVIIEDPTPEASQHIHRLKRELIFLRKSVWPLREVVNTMQRDESSLIQEKTRFFLRDVYDHTVQVIDTIETLRDLVSGMLDIYLSSVSNRMNETMKVLTIMATIFIPLTFVAGIYGMNFKFMPELDWKWSYPVVWIIMGIVALVMILWFRRKRFF